MCYASEKRDEELRGTVCIIHGASRGTDIVRGVHVELMTGGAG